MLPVRLQDIVAESHSFDLEGFLPLLQEYLTVGRWERCPAPLLNAGEPDCPWAAL